MFNIFSLSKIRQFLRNELKDLTEYYSTDAIKYQLNLGIETMKSLIAASCGVCAVIFRSKAQGYSLSLLKQKPVTSGA
jgi:hypothetical protein